MDPELRASVVESAREAFTQGTQLGMFAVAALMGATAALVAVRGR